MPSKVCEGCGTTKDLTVHHIVPRKIRQDDSKENLADLCIDCHALVERHYWRTIALKQPQVARLLKLANKMFTRKPRPPEEQLLKAQEVQREAWRILTSVDFNWRQMYNDAILWSRTVIPLRRVDPGGAIMSRPWWKEKE